MIVEAASRNIPVGATNYNFGGSCEATAVDALVHANTRSIPFPFPAFSHTPQLPHSFASVPLAPIPRYLSPSFTLPRRSSLFSSLVRSALLAPLSRSPSLLFIALSPTGPLTLSYPLSFPPCSTLLRCGSLARVRLTDHPVAAGADLGFSIDLSNAIHRVSRFLFFLSFLPFPFFPEPLGNSRPRRHLVTSLCPFMFN